MGAIHLGSPREVHQLVFCWCKLGAVLLCPFLGLAVYGLQGFAVARCVLQERASGVKANSCEWLQAAQVLPVGTTLLPTMSHGHGLNGTGIRATNSCQYQIENQAFLCPRFSYLSV